MGDGSSAVYPVLQGINKQTKKNVCKSQWLMFSVWLCSLIVAGSNQISS